MIGSIINMRHKKIEDLKVVNQPKKIFCTECGEELEDFSFTEKAENIEMTKENFERCKKIGKFKGEQCSKMFIAQSNMDEFSGEDFDKEL